MVCRVEVDDDTKMMEKAVDFHLREGPSWVVGLGDLPGFVAWSTASLTLASGLIMFKGKRGSHDLR